MRAAWLIGCWLLGGVFLASGALKSIDAKGPIMATAAYDMLPAWLALVLGAVLPALELVVGAALVAGLQRRAAAMWAVAMGCGFAIANGVAWWRHLVVDCQCFGGLSGSSVTTALVIDVLVIVLGVLVFRCRQRSGG